MSDPVITLEAAVTAAARLHAGQVDKGGQPYILHPLRVMLRVEDERERILAVLHDTAEDAGWDCLRAELGALPPWLEKGLDALTRRAGETYDAFIERAASRGRARRVKLADLADNLCLSRIPKPTKADRERMARYRRARRRLREIERLSRFGVEEEDFESGGVYFT